MLDTLGILLSTVAIVWVVLRAVKLDRDLPWFEVAPAVQEKEAVRRSRPRQPPQPERRGR